MKVACDWLGAISDMEDLRTIQGIARRPPRWATRTVEGRQRTLAFRRRPIAATRRHRVALGPAIDIVDLERRMSAGLAMLRGLYDDGVWRIIACVTKLPQVVITSILRQLPCFDASIRAPTTARALQHALKGHLNIFEPETHVTIEVPHSAAGLGDGVTRFKMERLHIAWNRIAKGVEAAGHRVRCEFRPEFRSTDGERLWGAGPQTGDIFHRAEVSCPVDGVPGLFGLSFDESAISSRGSGEMATGVYVHNLNVAGCNPALACRLVCFFPDCPSLEGVPKRDWSLKRKLCMQAVVGAILRTLRRAAGMHKTQVLRLCVIYMCPSRPGWAHADHMCPLTCDQKGNGHMWSACVR
jgi:hypothetical protein